MAKAKLLESNLFALIRRDRHTLVIMSMKNFTENFFMVFSVLSKFFQRAGSA